MKMYVEKRALISFSVQLTKTGQKTREEKKAADNHREGQREKVVAWEINGSH